MRKIMKLFLTSKCDEFYVTLNDKLYLPSALEFSMIKIIAIIIRLYMLIFLVEPMFVAFFQIVKLIFFTIMVLS